ncbi:uncharacterized protein [Primulina eburnea]|uniref:uncharacterized protein n=1 Tax=Primulina eburnea TaxID=1245227 RepID=UPI003C6C14B7
MMKAAQDRQASYANKRRRPLEFQVGDYVFLKLSPFWSTMRFGHKWKLAPRYSSLYVIVERIGTLAYRLDLPPSFYLIHNVFHVTMLRKYETYPSHILNFEDVELDSSLSYVEHPVKILDRKEKQLKSKTIPLVLVQWSRNGRQEFTWELEANMRQEWPHLFKNVLVGYLKWDKDYFGFKELRLRARLALFPATVRVRFDPNLVTFQLGFRRVNSFFGEPPSQDHRCAF